MAPPGPPVAMLAAGGSACLPMDAEDFAQVRDAVRQLVREVVVPREEEIDLTDRIPDELRAAAAEMGLFGYALPEEHGGLGVTMSEDVQLAFEFGYTTPAFRSLFGTNNGIAGQVIAKFGTEEQKKAYLPRLAAGELIGSFAPHPAGPVGSSARSPSPRPRPAPIRPACAPLPAAMATSG